MADSFHAAADTGVTVLNTVLAEEANRIGSDVHRLILHTSPWIDLIKKTSFPDGMGYQLTSLIYGRSIPTTDVAGSLEVTNGTWAPIANDFSQTTAFNTPAIPGDGSQPLDGAMSEEEGAKTGRVYTNVSKHLREYSLKKLSIESPKISLEDLRFAAHRTEHLRAITDLLADSARYTWESRYRDEYDRLAGKLVSCETTATEAPMSLVDLALEETAAEVANDKFTGYSTFQVNWVNSGTGNTDVTPTANISNAILDMVYFDMIRNGGGGGAYGRENGRPVFALVCSSEASYQLQTEAGFRDDVRYNNAKVSELIAPLGVEKSFRGFYHMIDDLAPRFNAPNTNPDLDTPRILPYNSTLGLVSVDPLYVSASYEIAYVLHADVMEAVIPSPFGGGGAAKFDPVSYKGEFKWTNIANAETNPDGTIGFFRGILASASKPLKTDFGYAIAFKRDSTTPAA